MKKNDKTFIERLGQLLGSDPETEISFVRATWENGDDYLRIVMKGGHAVQLRVTRMCRADMVKTVVTTAYGDMEGKHE